MYSSEPTPTVPAEGRPTAGRRQPNHRLLQARLARPSLVTPGQPTSRAELAEAVNLWVYEHRELVVCLDADHIRRYEMGHHTWPRTHYRAAFRALLGADRDADLGFHPRGATLQ